MDRKKLLKLIGVFFVLFTLSGVGTIMDYYYGLFPNLFGNLFGAYEILRLGTVRVIMPGVPFFVIIVTIAVFIFLMRKFYNLIAAEIKKEG